MTPSWLETITWTLSCATLCSIPVPTRGDSGNNRGTACLCIFDPIKALFASSCSKNGINEVDTLTIWRGDTSKWLRFSGLIFFTSSPSRTSTVSEMICPFWSIWVVDWPITLPSSSSADINSTSWGFEVT